MWHTLPVELGDAFRSWCASGDEDTANLIFNLDTYHELLTSYLDHAPFLSPEEIKLIPSGVLCITLELAARFLTDSVEESYFAHRPDRYATLREQNLTRALNQLSLYRSIKNLLVLV